MPHYRYNVIIFSKTVQCFSTYSGSLLIYYTVLLTHSFLGEGSEFHWLC